MTTAAARAGRSARNETASLAGVAYALPPRIVTNTELAAAHPAWRMHDVERKTGVLARRIAVDETSLDLAAEAVDALVYECPDAMQPDAILFCTQTPHQVMPANSALLHDRMGLGTDVLALDFTLACSGFVYGLALADGLLASGRASRVLLVTADTYSRIIDPNDRGPATVFGDGAAAALVVAGHRGLVDLIAETSGAHRLAFEVPRGGDTVRMDGPRILAFAKTHVTAQVRRLLERNNIEVADIDLFVFHQASAIALEQLAATLTIPPERMYSNLERVGNTVSASIPIALRDAIDEGRAGPGSRVLLSGFGVGMSWASAILEL